jgi:hypothetical protein
MITGLLTLVLYLGVSNQDRRSAGSVAKAILKGSPTARELVAAATTSTPVTETNIVCRHEARGARGIQAYCSTVVGAALASTNILGATGAVGDHRVLRCA